jgi:uncharacterized protein YndB with AHSA1/START domain
MTDSTDRIERKILLKVPRTRVWQVLTNAEEFGRWFCVHLEGKSFAVGKPIRGQVAYPGYEHITWEVWIERLEPERLFSWRWHPAAVDAGIDYSKEPTTLVVFELQDADGGTLLSVTESGFDQVPVERRFSAFRMNSEGWEEQMANIEKYVSAH